MISMKVERLKKIDTTKALYRTLQDVLESTTRVLTSKAKDQAPVRTGFLKASIKHSINKLRAYVRAWASYAGFVEYGTMYQHANPFMRRALEKTKRLLPTIIRRAYNRHFK